MDAMRQSWTDDRLDDFRADVNRRFDEVDRRFDEINAELRALNGRFDALNRTLLQIGGGIVGTLIAGFFAIVVTQL
jgi:tetrahydromethanopterin S-methyltransferase subunit G